MHFRSGIEGLRGVAVVLVVLAHAKVPGFSGGFTGVDVFFVISGFLITGLLTQELQRSGRIDYWSFFARRASRLAPALLAMVLLVGAFAATFLAGDFLALQLNSAFWASVWSSNLYFTFAGFDYFGSAATDSLFLHTWSLGVEEQFYLLWPLLTAIAWRRWGGSDWWLIFLAVAGFAFCLLLVSADSVWAYYLMPARLWQLATGALAYRLIAHNPGLFAARSNIFGVIGLGLLMLGMVVIDGEHAYPGWASLLPTLGAVGLLFAGYSGVGAVSWLLSTAVLRLPGKISYSWYLWHWPFLMFLPALGLGWPTTSQLLALLLLSFLVAWMSHRFIEEPFRRRRGSIDAKRVVAISILLSALLGALLQLGSALLVGGGDHARKRSALEELVFSQVSIPGIYEMDGCDQWYFSADLNPCPVPAGDGSRGTMVLIADSVGAQWVPALEYVARMQGRKLVVLTKSSCAIVDEPFFYGRINRRFTECEVWRERAIEYVRDARPDVVVIGSTGTYDFTPEQWNQGSFRVMSRLAETGRPVMVLAPTPALPFHGPRCVIARGSESSSGLEASDCSAALLGLENQAVIRALDDAAKSVPGGTMIYLNDLVCHEGVCSAVRDGKLLYRDEQHLNATFVESLGPAVYDRVRSVMIPNPTPSSEYESGQ